MFLDKFSGKTVSNVGNSLMTEEAVGILPATVENAVGLVIFHVEMLGGIVAHGVAHCIELGLAHSHVCQQIATASEIAECKGCRKAKFTKRLFPYYLGRHSRIALDAEVVTHEHLLSCRSIKVDAGKIFFAIEGDKCYCHSGDTIGHVAVVGIMK